MLRYSLRTRLLVVILLVATIPLAFLAYFGYSNTQKLIMEKEEENIDFFFTNIKEKIKFFNIINKHILFLRDVTKENISNIDEGIGELENIFYYFSQNNIVYDEVGLINKEGYEVIRINNDEGSIDIVPNGELSYRGDCYYIKRAYTLKKGKIYISNIEANTENGEIEKPLKPVIRYVIPIHVEDEFKGFLIVSLNLSYLFNDIERVRLANKYKNMMILDSEGYYLFHPNKVKEWGWKIGLNTEENFKNDYPQLFEEVMSAEKPEMKIDGKRISAWYPIEIESLDNRKTVMFLDIKRSDYLNKLTGFRNIFMFQVIISVLVLIAGGAMISFYLTKPILKIVKSVEDIGKGHFDVELEIDTGDELELLGYEIKKMSYEIKNMYKNMEELVDERTKELQRAHIELEEMATKDSLTGLYNRHYFNQYIQNIAQDEENIYPSLMILIIDVDKFKSINDNYGHNIGDVVLQEVAKMLKGCARESDLVVRYGGDEFLAALYNSERELAEKYIDRVKESLNDWNNNSDILGHELTLSIGYDEYNGNKHILEVINNADKMMYENKVAKRKKE